MFDLDGTLCDPKTGITSCFQYALQKLGHPVPTKDELEWVIGPPLVESFKHLFDGDIDLANQGVALYRERYAPTGLFEQEVYPGIPDLLQALVEQGNTLYMATSKPHVYAQKIAEHFGFDHLFKHIHGSELTGERVHKTDLLAYILEQEGLKAEQCIMIGDRKHDLIGAKANEIQTVGVTWGYGSISELKNEKPDYLIDTPKDLLKVLA